MPFISGCDDNFLFVSMGSLCKQPPMTCSASTPLLECVDMMHTNNITGLVVLGEDSLPMGVCSFRDVLRLTVESKGNINSLTVADGMHRGVISIKEHDFVFDAIFTMARHNIHRIVVVNNDGVLVGLVTVSDLLNLQTRTPLFLNSEIETAQSLEELKAISRKMFSTLVLANNAGADIKVLVKLISHFNDAQTRRLIYLLEKDEGIKLPSGFAYLALGSEGRGEQTLRTDQDSAIVYADNVSFEDRTCATRFACRMVEVLEELGVPRCPSDGMASNPKWFHSLSEWQSLQEGWITKPTPENMVDFGMFQDLRTLHGDESLEQSIHEHLCSITAQNSLYFVYGAKNIVRFTAPLGIFNRFKVESKGEHKGKIDIKKAGIFSITAGASLLALEAGIVGGTTWDKLEQLGERGVLSSVDLETVMNSFSYLVRLRLHRQLKAMQRGMQPSNYVDPMILSDPEKDRFRNALKGVNTFLRILKDHYQLDLMSR